MALELPRIAAVRYVAKSASLDALRKFYLNVCGLVEQSPLAGSPEQVDFRLPGRIADRSAHLVFDVSGRSESPDADSSRTDMLIKNYWKVGFGLDDVAAGVDSIDRNAGEQVLKQASQFMDVGYLTHMSDPVGLCIELLGNTQEVEDGGVPGTPQAAADQARRLEQLQASPHRSDKEIGVVPALGQTSLHSVVGQLTLRNSDPSTAVAFWRSLLGMQLLCREQVAQYGFILYFLGYLDGTSETAPADIDLVSAREWTYQLPLTTVEIQVRGGSMDDMSRDSLTREQVLAMANASLSAPPVPALAEGRSGMFAGTAVCVPAERYDWIAERVGDVNAPRVYLQDPDGTPVELFRAGEATSAS